MQQTDALNVVEGTGTIVHVYLGAASAPMMLPAEVDFTAHVSSLREADMLGVLKERVVLPMVCSSLHLAGCRSARLHSARRVAGVVVCPKQAAGALCFRCICNVPSKMWPCRTCLAPVLAISPSFHLRHIKLKCSDERMLADWPCAE